MATREWQIMEPTPHVVRVEHGWWSGKVVITINRDAQVYLRPSCFCDWGLDHKFEIAGIEYLVRVICRLGLYYTYELWVNGRRQ